MKKQKVFRSVEEFKRYYFPKAEKETNGKTIANDILKGIEKKLKKIKL